MNVEVLLFGRWSRGRQTRQRLKSLSSRARELDAEYHPQLEAFAKEKGRHSEEYQSLLSEAHAMRCEFTDEIEAIESRELLAEARRYFIDLSDIPPPKNGDSHMEDGHFDRYLSSEAFSALGKLLYKARREHSKERREKVMFWFGIVAALVGMSLTAYNTFSSQSGKLSDLNGRVSTLEKALAAPAKK